MNIQMLPFIVSVWVSTIFLTGISPSYAQDVEATEGIQKPKAPELQIECSWSKMNSQEYKACKAQQEAWKKKTPEERAKEQSEASEGFVVDENSRGAERRIRRANRGGGGVGGAVGGGGVGGGGGRR